MRLRWITDQDDVVFPFNVIKSAGVIPDAEIGNGVIKRVTGEIPPPDILIDRPVDIVTENAALDIVSQIIIHVIGRGPEGRDFNNLPTKANVRKAESPADQATITEQRAHFLGCRICRDIEVLGVQLQHGITNAAADQKSLIA